MGLWPTTTAIVTKSSAISNQTVSSPNSSLQTNQTMPPNPFEFAKWHSGQESFRTQLFRFKWWLSRTPNTQNENLTLGYKHNSIDSTVLGLEKHLPKGRFLHHEISKGSGVFFNQRLPTPFLGRPLFWVLTTYSLVQQPEIQLAV